MTTLRKLIEEWPEETFDGKELKKVCKHDFVEYESHVGQLVDCRICGITYQPWNGILYWMGKKVPK